MDDRAVNEVLGFILVFSLVLTMVIIVTVSGVPALNSAEDAQQRQNAMTAMDILANNVEDIYARGAPSRATEIDLHDAQLETGDHVRMTVTLHNTDAGTSQSKVWITRPIVYEGRSDTSIVYEAGGLFLVQDDGAITRQQPPFVVERSSSTERLYLPLLVLSSAERESVGGSTALVRTGSSSTSRPNIWFHETGGTSYNRLDLTIESPRHDRWKQYLEAKGFTCSTTGTTLSCQYEGSSLSDKLDTISIVAHEIPVSFEN